MPVCALSRCLTTAEQFAETNHIAHIVDNRTIWRILMDDSAIADNCDRPVPPDGRWRAIGNAGSFTDHCGTFYWRDAELEEPGDARFGFRVEQHHCNLRPTGHGGLLAMVADVFMARGALLVDGVATPLPTISLTIDYLAPRPKWSSRAPPARSPSCGRCCSMAMCPCCRQARCSAIPARGALPRRKPRGADARSGHQDADAVACAPCGASPSMARASAAEAISTPMSSAIRRALMTIAALDGASSPREI